MHFLQKIKFLLNQKYKRGERKAEYTIKIKNSFPIYLAEDVEKVISIILITDDLYVKTNDKQFIIDNAIADRNLEINLQKETIHIYYRIYFPEPNSELESNLNLTQRQILDCIYTRHCNGYIRERRLKSLSDIDFEWVLPFKLQLLGEYVIEILVELDKQITSDKTILYKQLIANNTKYWQQTKSRVYSYWNEYYRLRNFKNPEDYIGYKIMKRISD